MNHGKGDALAAAVGIGASRATPGLGRGRRSTAAPRDPSRDPRSSQALSGTTAPHEEAPRLRGFRR